MHCSHPECDKVAHAFCINNYLKDYLYDTNMTDEEQIPSETHETIYAKRWNFQLFMNEETNQMDIITNCKDHIIPGSLYCYCRDITKGNLVCCDSCYTWFHQECTHNLDRNEIDKDFFCERCLAWKDHLQSNLLDIILKKKGYQELLNED